MMRRLLALATLAALPLAAQNARRIQGLYFDPCPSITEGQGYFWSVARDRFICAAGGSGAGIGDALVANPLSQFASTTSAQVAGVVSNETGTGLLVFNTSPTLVTPVLTTPTIAATEFANAQHAHIGASSGGTLTEGALPFTDITTGNATTSQHGFLPKLGGGTANFLRADGTWAPPAGAGIGDALVANPLSQFASTTSAQLAGVMSNETGSGLLVFNTSPTLVTPILGVAAATTINKVAFTAPATGATLTLADGKTLTVNNSLTLIGTDGNSFTFPSGSDTVVTLGATQTLTAKTLTTPVISSTGFTNAQHAHIGATSGGALTESAIPFTDITTGNATTSQHGFLLKLGGGTSNFLRADGSWALPGGSGTVTVVGAGSLTSTACVTGGGTTTIQTPSTTCTIDTSGNLSTTGSVTSGAGSASAGFLQLGQGTTSALGTTAINIEAPTSVTSYGFILPGAAGDGVLLNVNAANKVTQSFVGTSGTGSFARVTSPAFTTPAIGAATGASVVLTGSLTSNALTSTRMVFAGASGILQDDSDCTFATDTLTCTKLIASTSLTVNSVPITGLAVPGSHSAAYTIVLADCNAGLLHPTADNNARTFTIDSNANVACPVGSMLSFFNQINTLTIAITSDTLQLAGTATTGSRSLAAGGVATAWKITTTLWVINGTGLT